MAAKDQFAAVDHARVYRSYRRDTPDSLVQKIVSVLKEKYDGPLSLAVDVGCGSGQSTAALAPYFERVHGMDVAEAQIQEAKHTRALPNVTFEAAPSETLRFDDGSVQLISAGAALHWFQLDQFFPEARRVLCNNGVLAVYCYYSIKPDLDDPAKVEEVTSLYEEFSNLTAGYHAPQAKIAYDRYKSVTFPFEEVRRIGDVRDFFEGELINIVGYVSSFSGFQNFKRQNEKKATEFLSYFEQRLRDIVTSCKIDPDKPMKMFSDFYLIICRKVE